MIRCQQKRNKRNKRLISKAVDSIHTKGSVYKRFTIFKSEIIYIYILKKERNRNEEKGETAEKPNEQKKRKDVRGKTVKKRKRKEEKKTEDTE